MDSPCTRLSVRRLVEFSLRAGDLTPANAAAMYAGMLGHKARQQQSGAEGAENERAVRWTGTRAEIALELYGRADIFYPTQDPPLVEELKLCAAQPPAAPLPAHRAQALCYAFMLCEELGLSQIALRVSYITQQGDVCAVFDETLTREQAAAEFEAIVLPYARFRALQDDYLAQRNASIAQLPFPYPSFRPGQREMAAQVYTAIARQKRLFACLPTGTGKSAATLFPALKALGEGKTEQIFYLTARGTTQQAVLDALARMCAQELIARWVVLTSKEKCCPQAEMRCHPDFCPRAKGYYDRELPALMDISREKRWDPARIDSLCEQYCLCPFEFSLLLCETADVVVCDYNYAFDPLVSLRRIFEAGRTPTLLIDEAHNLPSRVRDMLSCTLDSREAAAIRRESGKLRGRKDTVYQALTAYLQALRPCQDALQLSAPMDALLSALTPVLVEALAEGTHELYRTLLLARLCLKRMQAHPQEYQALHQSHGKEQSVHLLRLDIAGHLADCTRRMRGCVYFSATLDPLPRMRQLLGGTEEDATFALPSPFPSGNLMILQRGLDTRYQQREATARQVALSLLALYDGQAGKYIAYFPSYAYLELIRDQLLALRPELLLHVQQRSMDEAARAEYLHRFETPNTVFLALCVLGGIFSEGIDLPGARLIGTAVVGVGLPQVNPAQEALRACYDAAFADGFGMAYRYPGMHRVLQAVGRVIRSETDCGVALLLDDRYADPRWQALMPPHYHPQLVRSEDEIRARSQDFWRTHGI